MMTTLQCKKGDHAENLSGLFCDLYYALPDKILKIDEG
jgi:hypothetical protein